jgi:hypothetical protein
MNNPLKAESKPINATNLRNILESSWGLAYKGGSEIWYYNNDSESLDEFGLFSGNDGAEIKFKFDCGAKLYADGFVELTSCINSTLKFIVLQEVNVKVMLMSMIESA